MQTLEAMGLADNDLRERVRTGTRHELRDRQFLRSLAQYFRPGSILEIGASTGHLSVILKEYGYDVTASDVTPKLVEAIVSRGLKATLVDATKDIPAQTGCRFSNILAQSVGPLFYRNREQVLTTLRCIHDALEPSGRFICIGPYARHQPGRFFSPREQIEIARASGLFRMVVCYPHQIMPPSFYRPWNARLLNVLDHTLAHIASIRLVWVLERPAS